jgi:hypothetical protein
VEKSPFHVSCRNGLYPRPESTYVNNWPTATISCELHPKAGKVGFTSSGDNSPE